MLSQHWSSGGMDQVNIPKASLNDLKALAPAINKVLCWNTNILVDNLTVTFRSIIVAEHAHGADNFHARRVRGDYDNALLPVPVRVLRVALTEHEVERTTRISCPTDVPGRHNSDMSKTHVQLETELTICGH